MNTANLGVDKSLETTLARNQSAILWKIQDAILHLVKLRNKIGEETSYNREDVDAKYSRNDNTSGRISSEIWTEVRQGNFWTSLRQDFDNSIEPDSTAEMIFSQWEIYMKWINDKAVIQCLAEEIVFTR